MCGRRSLTKLVWLEIRRSRPLTKLRKLFLEEHVGCRFGSVLALHLRFETRDLVLEQRDPLGEFAHRQQRKLLPHLMGDLLLRQIVRIDPRHRCRSLQSQMLMASSALVTRAGASSSSKTPARSA